MGIDFDEHDEPIRGLPTLSHRRCLHLDHVGRASQWQLGGTWTLLLPRKIALARAIEQRETLRRLGVDPYRAVTNTACS
jgi:hypothetical protein